MRAIGWRGTNEDEVLDHQKTTVGSGASRDECSAEQGRAIKRGEIVGLAEVHASEDASAGGQGATADSSVSSAIEHLLASSQAVIAERVDLALLEGHGVLSDTLRRAVLAGFGMVLGAGAWFAAAACLAVLITPNANLVLRLAAFGLLNAAGASVFVALAMRARPRTRVPASGGVSGTTGQPSGKDLP